MLSRKNILLIPLLAAAFMIAGCYHSGNPVGPMEFSGQIQTQSQISKITIPAGAVIDSAAFVINVDTAISEMVSLYAVANLWEENSVTWNSFSAGYDATSEADFTPDNPGWYSIDVTSLVNSWMDSTAANNGILLKEESPAGLQYYSSRESGTAPYLKVYWTLNGMSQSDSTAASADAFINSGDADANFGDSTALITGWTDTTEYQSLIKFGIEWGPVYTGCTRGYGYWKTHSGYGPAPYDSVWAGLGEDSTFFLSNQSNYEVMWTAPKRGNAYYMLAHMYITTDLNFLGGADPTAVQTAFDDATALFETYTPEDIGKLKGNDPLRKQFISLKNMLGQYNDGTTGPGSCDNIMSYRSVSAE